jgi:non-heme chloroperoxidase
VRLTVHDRTSIRCSTRSRHIRYAESGADRKERPSTIKMGSLAAYKSGCQLHRDRTFRYERNPNSIAGQCGGRLAGLSSTPIVRPSSEVVMQDKIVPTSRAPSAASETRVKVETVGMPTNLEYWFMPLRTFCRAIGAVMMTATLLAVSSTALAEQKEYTITAPDGVALAVQESGNANGPPVIFIHGYLGSHLDWDEQLKSPLLQRYRLITYDLRGHGLSGKPASADAYTEGRRWADDLAAVIESSHAQKPVLVGWSLGGAVISNYLAAYNDDRIAGAVYVDGVIELKSDQLVAHPAVYRDLVSPDLKTHLDTMRTFLGLCFHRPPDRATFERLLANAAMASWDMQRSILSITIPAAEGLSKAHVPVLLVYGARDAIINSKPAIARAVGLNPRIQSKLYANSGHAPFLEELDRFNRDLSNFIDTALSR